MACSAFPQEMGTAVRLTGVISDTNNVPLSNVGVRVKNTIYSTYSDETGRYVLPLTRGRKDIVISFSHINYELREVPVSTLNADELILDISLDEKNNALDSVSIVRAKPRTASLDQLNVKRANFLPNASGGTIESLLSTQAGVSTTNELSSQYSVRGGNFDENMVYVNGMEIYRPLLVRSAQQEGLSFINPDMVQSVGFSTGGYAAEYGDKMSSVLDIQYRKPNGFEGAVEGGFLGGSAYIGNSYKGFSQITGIRYKTNEPFLNASDMGAEYDPSFMDMQSFINYEISPQWNIFFLGNYSHNKYSFTPQARETKFGTLANAAKYNVSFTGWENDKFINYHLSGGMRGQITDKLEMEISGGYFSSYERENYDITGKYTLSELVDDDGSGGNLLGIGSYHEHARNRLDADVYNLSYRGKLSLYNNQLKWGITYQKEQIEDHIKEWEMRDSTGYSLPHTGEVVSVYSNLKSQNKQSSNRYSGYVQDRFLFASASGLFILNGGVRFGYWSFNKELNVSPRASLSYVPDSHDRFVFRVATGVYYQTPFYREMQQIRNINGNRVVELNGNIKSQRSTHYLLGSDMHFSSYGRPFKLTGEIYYKNLSDIIPYTVNNVKIRYTGENEAKGYITGIDFRLSGEFIAGADSWVSLSLMKTQQDIQGVKIPLPTDQRYNISAYFQDYMPGYDRFRMSLLGHYSHGLPVSPSYKGFDKGYFRKPAYKRIDLGFAWQLLGEDFSIRQQNRFYGSLRNVWIGLDVFNIFDIKNTNTYYWITDVHNNQYAVPNYLTGRQLNLKLRAEF